MPALRKAVLLKEMKITQFQVSKGTLLVPDEGMQIHQAFKTRPVPNWYRFCLLTWPLKNQPVFKRTTNLKLL